MSATHGEILAWWETCPLNNPTQGQTPQGLTVPFGGGYLTFRVRWLSSEKSAEWSLYFHDQEEIGTSGDCRILKYDREFYGVVALFLHLTTPFKGSP